MIRYMDSIATVNASQLRGFFEGWANRPDPEMHLRLLRQSDAVILAIDDETDAVVGFITAITDGVLTAYIPFLEVLPGYRQRGIGGELVRRMLKRLDALYMVDVVCDAEVLPFYKKLGMQAGCSAMLRRYQYQGG